MSTAVANSQELPLGRFVGYSVILHVALAATIAASIFFKFKGDQWSGLGGNIGQSMNVTIVPAAGIPMPQPPSITEAKAFDPTEGIYKETPQPKPPTPPKVFESKKPVPDNAINYGKGGRPLIPVGNSPTPGISAPTGVSVPGQGGGDFA